MPLFQKPLGWVQRFLYNVEAGAMPFPQPVLSVDHDWPLEIKNIRQTGTTAVGTAQKSYAPGNEKHGLVCYSHILFGGAGVPATDQIIIYIESPDGLFVRLSHWGGTAIGVLPLIGGGSLTTTSLLWRALPPIYVAPGWQLILENSSVAGGVTFTWDVSVVERLKSYPLRLP